MQSQDVQMIGRIHADLFSQPRLLIPGLKIHGKLTKGRTLTLDNAIFGRTPKRIVFTMTKNSDFIGSKDSNPFNFEHYKLTYFSMNVNGRQLQSGGLSLDTNSETTPVLAYDTLFTGCCIHHADTGLQISHTMYLNGFSCSSLILRE
jgi:hypothetical protein